MSEKSRDLRVLCESFARKFGRVNFLTNFKSGPSIKENDHLVGLLTANLCALFLAYQFHFFAIFLNSNRMYNFGQYQKILIPSASGLKKVSIKASDE